MGRGGAQLAAPGQRLLSNDGALLFNAGFPQIRHMFAHKRTLEFEWRQAWKDYGVGDSGGAASRGRRVLLSSREVGGGGDDAAILRRGMGLKDSAASSKGSSGSTGGSAGAAAAGEMSRGGIHGRALQEKAEARSSAAGAESAGASGVGGRVHDSMLCHLIPLDSYTIPRSCGPNTTVCCMFDFRRQSDEFCVWPDIIPAPQPITGENVAARVPELLDQVGGRADVVPSILS